MSVEDEYRILIRTRLLLLEHPHKQGSVFYESLMQEYADESRKLQIRDGKEYARNCARYKG